MRSKICNFSFFIFHFSLLFFIFHLSLISSVSAGEASGKMAGAGQTVATVGNEKITVGELKEYMASRPAAFGGQKANEAAARLLDEMVTLEVLYQEALRLKLDQDPEIRMAIQQMLSRKLLVEKIEQPVMTRTISDKELEKYFNSHRREFVRPEEVRVADIFIAVKDDLGRAEKRKLAGKVLAEAKKVAGKRFGFSELVSKYSDQHPKYHIGDTGYFDRQGAPVGLDPKLAEAAFSIKKNGQLFDGVVETNAGFHVIMRVGYRSAVEKTYKDVKPQLEQLIRREELDRKRADYLQDLKKHAQVNIKEKVLQSFAEEMQDARKTRPASGPGEKVGAGSRTPPPLPQMKMKNEK